MRRVSLSIVCILVASIALASNVSAGPRDEYYAPYPPASLYAPPAYYPPAAYYAPPTYYAAPPIPYYAPRVYGYLPPPVAYYAPPEPLWVPPRPSSCGKYRYWNGEYCADARYERPYVGPRW